MMTKSHIALRDFSIVSLSIVCFALLYHTNLFIAICFLLLSSYTMQRGATFEKILGRFGLIPFQLNRKLILQLIAGLLLGLCFGVLYRHHLKLNLMPNSLFYFAFLAAGIGAVEELIYRGYLQGLLRKFGALSASLGASLSHTAYKAALFIFIPSGFEIDLWFLITWTFMAGLFFSALREFSQNTIPAILAHGIFDIVVYGNSANTPWWIWN